MFALSFIPVIAWYVILGIEATGHGIYGATYFKWVAYFPFMLLGSIVGMKRKNDISNGEAVVYKTLQSLVFLMISIITFYGFCVFKNKPRLEALQLMSIPPLLATVYYFWRFCNSKLMYKALSNKYLGSCLLFVGGLCLEIYVGQGAVFTTKINHLFPLNIPIILLGVIIYAYFLRCCARLWSQTFKDEPYNWNEIIKFI